MRCCDASSLLSVSAVAHVERQNGWSPSSSVWQRSKLVIRRTSPIELVNLGSGNETLIDFHPVEDVHNVKEFVGFRNSYESDGVSGIVVTNGPAANVTQVTIQKGFVDEIVAVPGFVIGNVIDAVGARVVSIGRDRGAWLEGELGLFVLGSLSAYAAAKQAHDQEAHDYNRADHDCGQDGTVVQNIHDLRFGAYCLPEELVVAREL